MKSDMYAAYLTPPNHSSPLEDMYVAAFPDGDFDPLLGVRWLVRVSWGSGPSKTKTYTGGKNGKFVNGDHACAYARVIVKRTLKTGYTLHWSLESTTAWARRATEPEWWQPILPESALPRRDRLDKLAGLPGDTRKRRDYDYPEARGRLSTVELKRLLRAGNPASKDEKPVVRSPAVLLINDEDEDEDEEDKPRRVKGMRGLRTTVAQRANKKKKEDSHASSRQPRFGFK